jgi:paraquat-inducible protein B
MNGRDDQRDEPREGEAPQARVQVARWSPWVWILPLIAILFVGWLVMRYGFLGGGDVTVRFADARGLDRYSPVRFKGAKVGTVQRITIDEHLEEVVVSISMDASMNHALRKDTRFWIVEPGLEGGGLGSLISGTYVAIAPGSSDEEADEFVGQEYAPILNAPEKGRIFILEADRLGSLSAGSPVNFEGVRVGRVLGAEHDPQRGSIRVYIFVVNRYVNRVRESTRFFRSGGVSISLAGGGVSMGDASLSSLLTGGIAFYTPAVLAGLPAAERSQFVLHDSQAAAIAAADGPHLTYMTYFPGPIGGLSTGTRVEMKGVQVGHVREVRLVYVPETANLITPVTLEIDPREMDFEILPSTTRDELRRRTNEALDAMVRKGMRATLSSSLVLPGAGAVSLDMVARPGTARLVLTQDPPLIPAAASDKGLATALASINRVARRIEDLPLSEIAGHMRSAAQRVDAMVQDPALQQSLRRMNNAMADIEKVAAIAGENVEPIVQSLRTAATSAESAASRVEQLMGNAPQQNYDLAELVKELTKAAEAVRALANYLTENPDSLLKGRPK